MEKIKTQKLKIATKTKNKMAYTPREIPGAPNEEYHSSGYDSKSNQDAGEEYHSLYNVLKEEDGVSKDYISNKKDNKEGEEESIKEQLDREEKEKYKKEDEAEEVAKKADDEIHNSILHRNDEGRKQKLRSTIEDAINRAMEK